MRSTLKRQLTRLALSSTVLTAGAFLFGCAAGGTLPSSSASGGNGGGDGSGGAAGSGGMSGSGGDAGSAGSGGAGGAGGTGGSSAKLGVCVLNDGGPADPCADPANLAFDIVPAGTQRMRVFRIDNESNADAIFETVTVQDPDFSVETVRYVEDPPNDPSQWLRVPVTLPSTRPPGGKLYFEVTYTSKGNAELLAPAEAVVTATIDGMQASDVVVPIVGEVEGCATGMAVCDQDPNNGCDTNTNTTTTHCGSCDNVCNLPNASPDCEAGNCVVATCSAGFDDCNGMDVDGCEVDTTTNMNHCGGCGSVCELANANEVCSASQCSITACISPFQNCDATSANGCETNVQTDLLHCGACNSPCSLANATEACVAGACTITMCDTSFGDCDMLPGNGCEVNTNMNASHCGACGNACNLPNAVNTCTSGMCGIGMCAAGYGNCDGMTPNGCETNVATNTLNCGACNNNCSTTMVNANVGCTAGACQLLSCLPGYGDADGVASNGCECTVGGTDLPDDTFADTNCDGIDGDASAAIFVATTGNDSNPGTRQQPVLTIAAALVKAVQQNKKQVYVSAGVYNARVTLVSGISIYGGYSAQNNWARSASHIVTIQSSAVINGRVAAVEGKDLITAMTLDRLNIRTFDTLTAGVSNYAMYCNNCPAVTVRNSSLIAGSAGPGTAGGNGVNGSAGVQGSNGSAGACDSSGTRTGGPGGTSSCGRTGGSGGTGGAAGANPGANGSNGISGTVGGSGGAGGNPGQHGTNGANGTSAANGSSGAAGSGGSTMTNFWVGNAGGNGAAGGNGNGGGGGGGGGGQGGGFSISGGGNGGGGGGGGGCGAAGGAGGTAGGGSFGLFLINSNGMQLVGNSITSAKGGNGGAGGSGGNGGAGGAAGSGATTCSSEVGAGGNGGTGGKGGNGGHGGGGAGGPSYSVYRVNSSSVTTTGNILVFGMGGTGGPSTGNPGVNGSAGQVF